jgi:hypothetical protein
VHRSMEVTLQVKSRGSTGRTTRQIDGENTCRQELVQKDDLCHGSLVLPMFLTTATLILLLATAAQLSLHGVASPGMGFLDWHLVPTLV